MKIISQTNTEELIEEIRNVPLLNDREIKVYSKSNITIKQFYPDELNIAKITFIKSNLDRTEKIYRELLKHNIDILQLDRKITYQDDEGKKWVMIPPIVELANKSVRYIPAEGEVDPKRVFNNIRIPILGDGAHRGYLAMKLGCLLKVVFISNVDKRYPYYAYPNDWNEANLVTEAQAQSLRKYFVWEEKYKLYRDFSSISTGGVRAEGSKGY